MGTVTVFGTTTLTTLAGTETVNLVYVSPLCTSTVFTTTTLPCVGGGVKRVPYAHAPKAAENLERVPRASFERDVGAAATTISTVVLYSHPPQMISTTTTAVLTVNSFSVYQTTTTVGAATVTTGPATVTVITSTVTFLSYAQVISVSTTSSGLVTVTSTVTLPATPCAGSSTSSGIMARRLGKPLHKHKQPWQIKETEFAESSSKLVERGI
jgi:hypothetical protein